MSISSIAKAAAFAQETDAVFLLLLEINHSALSQPIRLVLNNENVTHQGNEYIAFYFDISIPDDSEEMPRVSISVDNVDRSIVDAVRSATTKPTASLTVILAETPDVIEAGPFDMVFYEVEYDASTVRGTLIYEDLLNEPYPKGSYNPSTYPGIF